MPHRRRIEKGSFAGHFDELVKHFTNRKPPSKATSRKSKPKRVTPAKLNQELFERANR